jgi:Flp pilus assembly protein TadD
MIASGERVLSRASDANRGGRHRRAIELANTGLNRVASAELTARLKLERAKAFVELRDFVRAEADCRQALSQVAPPGAESLLARCLLELERSDEARDAIERELSTNGGASAEWQLAARIHSRLGDHERAVAAAQTARAFDRGVATLEMLSDALGAAGRHDERVEVLERELASGPGSHTLWAALGYSRYAVGRSEAAIAAFRCGIALDAHSVEAHCGLAWVLLRLGHFEEGFRHQEYRQGSVGGLFRFGVEPFRGEPVDGKSVLVLSEQGFGDTLQFARFVPILRRRGAHTILTVAPPLVRLLRSNPELGVVDPRQPRFGAAERNVLLMSLPHLLELRSDLALAELPLFRAEPERVAAWRRRLPPGPKIALFFQGNPRYGGEPWRSMPFRHFEPLIARLRGKVTFLSLQKHVGREQLREASLGSDVMDLGDCIDEKDAFVDSLAILQLVDRFLTTDSSPAHLAGSAGAEAWILLSYVADWRWGTGDRTPWYPSLRLFRQAAPGDWEGVVHRVGEEIEAQLAGRPRPRG